MYYEIKPKPLSLKLYLQGNLLLNSYVHYIYIVEYIKQCIENRYLKKNIKKIKHYFQFLKKNSFWNQCFPRESRTFPMNGWIKLGLQRLVYLQHVQLIYISVSHVHHHHHKVYTSLFCVFSNLDLRRWENFGDLASVKGLSLGFRTTALYLWEKQYNIYTFLHDLIGNLSTFLQIW